MNSEINDLASENWDLSTVMSAGLAQDAAWWQTTFPEHCGKVDLENDK